MFVTLFIVGFKSRSRVCAVAQYAALEANAKVNGRGPFSHPHPSETPQPISMSCPPRELMCKIRLESIRPLRICVCVKKHDFVWIFLLTYLSICLSVRFFVGATGHSFVAILTLNGSNDVIPQPLVPFGGHINIAPY